MAFLIDDARRDQYEILKIRKKRADSINGMCFVLAVISILYVIIMIFLAIGNYPNLRKYAPFLVISIACEIFGCLKRRWPLNALAIVLDIAGCIFAGVFPNPWLIANAAAVYANYIDEQLSKEEGYPQFDLSLEENLLREQIRRSSQADYLAENRAAAAEKMQQMQSPAQGTDELQLLDNDSF